MPEQQHADIISASEAIEAMTGAEIDKAIATAKRFPRDLKKFKREAMEMALVDVETAEACYYKLPRAGNEIFGPSVRLAEIAQYCFHNIRAGKRVISIDDKMVTAQGVCVDMERNNWTQYESVKSIVDKNGNRYSADMITMTAGAAMAVAYRNAVFNVIPGILIDPIYRACLEMTITGDNLDGRIKAALVFFKSKGFSNELVLQWLDVESIEQITGEHLVTLRGVINAVKDGDTTYEATFGSSEKPAAEAPKLAAGKRAAGAKARKEAAAPEETQAEGPQEPAQESPAETAGLTDDEELAGLENPEGADLEFGEPEPEPETEPAPPEKPKPAKKRGRPKKGADVVARNPIQPKVASTDDVDGLMEIAEAKGWNATQLVGVCEDKFGKADLYELTTGEVLMLIGIIKTEKVKPNTE